MTKKLGGPPKTFTDEQKKLWREFVKIVPTGVATYADRWAVEIIVCTMAKFRAGTIRAYASRPQPGRRDGTPLRERMFAPHLDRT